MNSYCTSCRNPIQDPRSLACPSCGNARPVSGWSRDPLLGILVDNGKYRVEALLGAGGFSKVYRVRHTMINERMLAMKVLNHTATNNREAEERFINEMRILMDFQHPHVIHVSEVGRLDEGNPFILMELLHGRDLDETVLVDNHSTPFSPERVINLAEMVASALGAAHSRGILHRDLKPDNILLLGDHDLRIIDFGIAKLNDHGDSNDGFTLSQLIGTPLYMAPEQFTPGARVDERLDIYQLGAVLHFALTAQPPYQIQPSSGKNQMTSLMHIVRQQELYSGRIGPKPSRFLPSLAQIAPKLDLLVAHMLSTDPEWRPSNAAQLLHLLHLCHNPNIPTDSITNIILSGLHTEVTDPNLFFLSSASSGSSLQALYTSGSHHRIKRPTTQEHIRSDSLLNSISQPATVSGAYSPPISRPTPPLSRPGRHIPPSPLSRPVHHIPPSPLSRPKLTPQSPPPSASFAAPPLEHSPPPPVSLPPTPNAPSPSLLELELGISELPAQPSSTDPIASRATLQTQPSKPNSSKALIGILTGATLVLSLVAAGLFWFFNQDSSTTSTQPTTKTTTDTPTKTPSKTQPSEQPKIAAVDPGMPGDNMVRVSAGTFSVGSPANESGRGSDERIFTATLTRDFFVQKTEVTQKQWREVMDSSPSFFSACGPTCPVERVNWFEAVAFANQLSKRENLDLCYDLEACTGQPGEGCAEGEDWCLGDFECQIVRFNGTSCTGYRLPTEIEWEHVARAGRTESRPQNLDQHVWYGSNSFNPKERKHPKGTQPVATRKPNPLNVHDTLGNVYEWVWDTHTEYPRNPPEDYASNTEADPRVNRGCSFKSNRRDCRFANRFRRTPEERNSAVGFRLVRTAPTP